MDDADSELMQVIPFLESLLDKVRPVIIGTKLVEFLFYSGSRMTLGRIFVISTGCMNCYLPTMTLLHSPLSCQTC